MLLRFSIFQEHPAFSVDLFCGTPMVGTADLISICRCIIAFAYSSNHCVSNWQFLTPYSRPGHKMNHHTQYLIGVLLLGSPVDKEPLTSYTECSFILIYLSPLLHQSIVFAAVGLDKPNAGTEYLFTLRFLFLFSVVSHEWRIFRIFLLYY